MNFKSLYLGSDTSLLTKIGTITVNTFFSMRNKFVYSCNTKVHVLGFDKLLESIFWLLLVGKAFSLVKVVKMLEAMIVVWWEVRWIWQMRQNFIPQFIQLWSIGCVTCSWVVLCWRIGPLLLASAGCRCWSFGTSHQFAERTFKL